MVLKIGGTVEKVDCRELSYVDFAARYLDGNRPVVLTGLTEEWRACKEWVFDDGKPNLRFFSEQFGASRVQVADCGTREFSDQKRVGMSVTEFIDCCVDRDIDKGGPLLYLKDWHFVKAYPDYVAYSTPLFFLDDWLNIYLDKYRMHDHSGSYGERDELRCSDYRFVYMGTKGTWTPLHADVFRSYSWSANVCGRKKWYFLPPSQVHLVFDRYMKSAVYDIFEDVCSSKFPGFEKAVWWECTQEQNEVIFVPSGWYHQVHNLEETISINHNWFNGYNLSDVWDLLLREYSEAKSYIEDIKDICDDFEGLCQRNLAANAGMDFRDFFILVTRFALANLTLLCHSMDGDSSNTYGSSPQMVQLLLFNLDRIRCIGLKMKSSATPESLKNVSVDLIETMEDQLFMDFCVALGRTYRLICNQSEFGEKSQKLVMQNHPSFLQLSVVSSICCPDELIAVIDSAMNLLVAS